MRSVQKKLYLGQKLRRLREQRGLTQAALAKVLDISPSYLNQLEGNQRPITLAVVMKLASTLEVEPAAFLEDEDSRLVSDMKEVLGDPLFAGAPLSAAELRNVVGASPELARRMLSLHQAYQKLHEKVQSLADSLHSQDFEDPTGAQFPYEEVRDYFHYCNNYVGALDEAAERLWETEGLRSDDLQNDLIAYLKRRHDVRTTLSPDLVVEGASEAAMRRYDPATGTLTLSTLLNGPSRAFHLAHQIALLGFGDLIRELAAAAKLSSDDARNICRVGLANYFAGALVMPYRAFLAEAKALRHDIERLQSRFGANFEQVCHRLSTLQRPGARGLPFYFVRVDKAGNINKRHSATRFHFARFGGACPLWNVHDAFAQPDKILVQFARMPDQTAYICIARTVTKRSGTYARPPREFAVGLGCEVSFADELVYAAGIDTANIQAAVPIGVNCRICERNDCQQRAFPPIGSQLTVDENRGSFVPYRFRPVGP